MLILVNEFDLSTVAKVNSVNIVEARKNTYKNEVGAVVNEIVIPGRISINCSMDTSNKEELVKKLNRVQPYLSNGQVNVDGVIHEVTILRNVEQSTNFENFDLVFSWNGKTVENNILQG